MSLDIDLLSTQTPEPRECLHCGSVYTPSPESVFECNITHNLTKMADAAGIYGAVWRPDENGFETAGQIIEPLRRGIELLESDPERFKAFSAKNGWGTYEQFIPWLKKYLSACLDYPLCKIRVSR